MKKCLIILSLCPLFFLTFIENLPWRKLVTISIKSCIVWIIISIIIYIKFKYFFKYGRESGYTIKEIVEEKEAGLNFFLALILPIMKNDIGNFNNFLSFIVLLIIVTMLVNKTNLYYQNPILTIAGYKVYKFKFNNNQEMGNDEYIGISFNNVNGNNTIEYKKIEDNILIIKQMR